MISAGGGLVVEKIKCVRVADGYKYFQIRLQLPINLLLSMQQYYCSAWTKAGK